MVGWSINLKCTSQKDKQNETSGITQNPIDRCSYYKFINIRQKHVFYSPHIREMDFDGNVGPGWTVKRTTKKIILTGPISMLKSGVKRYNEELNGLR